MRPPPLRLLVWIFERVLLSYPSAFRARFGAQMTEVFRAALHDRAASAGTIRAAAFGVRGLLNLAAGGLAERRFERQRRRTRRVRPRQVIPLRALADDVRFALRRLRRQPGVTSLAVLTFAVGVGAATAVFSVVDASLLRPIALPQSRDLVAVFETSRGTAGQVSYPNLLDLASRTRTISALAGMRAQSVNLTGLEVPDRVRGAFVTGGFFDVTAVRPSHGRALGAEDDVANGPAAVVINYGVWQRHFGGSADVLGRRLTLNNIPFTVVGVMPVEFWFPFDGAEVWMPARFMPASRARSARTLTAFGRLRPGVTVEQADADLAAIAATLAVEHPADNADTGAAVEPLHAWLTADVRDQLVLLFGLVLVLVAAGTANVASLQVAATIARRTEIAIHAALGAGRVWIVRQAVVEHLAVAAIGGALGVLLAVALVPAAIAAAPSEIFNLHRAAVDGRVIVFAILVTITAGLASALIPSLYWTGKVPGGLLGGTGRSIGDRALHRMHGWLAAGQVAIAAVLLTTGGLLVRSYMATAAIDPGFDADGVHTLEYRLPANKYDPPAQARFHAEVVERVAAVPGVRGAAAVRALPFSGNGNVTAFRTERTPATAEPSTAELNTVTDDYFRLLGIRLLRGRLFASSDTASAPMVVVVSRSLAEREWPGENPIDRVMMPVGVPIRARVVGVVDDVRHRSLADRQLAACYVRNAQNPGIFMTLVAKVDGDASVVAPSIRRAVWQVDPDQPVWKERSLESLVRESLRGDLFLSSAVGIFSAAALLLVAAGVYGVVSQSVARRSREIGVRMALGATRHAVLGEVLRRGLKIVLIGSVAGLIVSLWIGRLMQSWLHPSAAFDVLPYLFAIVALTALAIAACYGPARRAAAIDPSRALRSQF